MSDSWVVENSHAWNHCLSSTPTFWVTAGEDIPKQGSGLFPSIQPWMEMYILAATPGFTEAQLVSLGGLLPHGALSDVSLPDVLHTKRGSLTPGPLPQLTIRVTCGQLQPSRESRGKQTWLFWDAHQQRPSSHLIMVKTCETVTSAGGLASLGLWPIPPKPAFCTPQKDDGLLAGNGAVTLPHEERTRPEQKPTPHCQINSL